jgi:hypothetical protein
MVSQLMLIFCLVGPTPPAGYHAPWADVRMVLRVPAGQHLLVGFGETRDVRPVEGVMWNDAGNEIPVSGATTSGWSADGRAVWKTALTGNLWQPRHGGMPESEPVPYHIVTLNLETPMDRVGLIGTRDDPGSVWGVAHGWNHRWPGMSGSGDDIIRGAQVWSVPCL